MRKDDLFADDVRVALDAFRRIVRALRTASRDSERRVGLSGAQLFALQQLANCPGASVNDLAERTFTHQSSMSVVIQRLVDRKLVVKVAARDDRRRLQLALTDAGRAVLRRSPEPMQDRLIAGLTGLSKARRHTLAHALQEVALAMASGAAHPPMFFEENRVRPARAGRRTTRASAPRRTRRTPS